MSSMRGQVSLIKSSSISNTVMRRWGLLVGLKKDPAPLLHCCWILHLASRLVDDCISCAVIAVCPLGLLVCSLSLAPLGCAADCSSFLKKWVMVCGLPHDTYLYSGQPTRISWWGGGGRSVKTWRRFLACLWVQTLIQACQRGSGYRFSFQLRRNTASWNQLISW